MTYAELVTLLKQYLENQEATFVANIPVFVRLAEEDIYRTVQLPFLRANKTSLTFTGGIQYFTLPSDYLSSYSFAVINNGRFEFLLNKDVNFIREAYPDPAVTGVPRFYAQFSASQYIVAPSPASNYQTELNYYFFPETLATAGTNWLSRNAENALLFGCLYHGYIYMKGDQDVANMYKEKYEAALGDLKTISEGRDRKDTYRVMDSRVPT
jgi:hypothetical protein